MSEKVSQPIIETRDLTMDPAYRAVADRLKVRVLEGWDAADIARRTFYHHFECKHEMLVPIARARTKALNRRIDELLVAG